MSLKIGEAKHLNEDDEYYHVMQDVADLMRNTSVMPGEAEENAARTIQMVLNHQERES